MIQFLLVPIYVNYLNIKLLGFMDTQNNGLNTAEIRAKLTAHKQVALVHDININILKKKSKELGCSLNDVILTCVSRMFKKYLDEKTDDKTTKQIRLAFPLSIRAPPKSIDDFQLMNQFAIVPMDVKLVDDMPNGLKTIKQGMDKMKKSFEPFAWMYVTKLTMQLPEFARSALLEIFTNKMTFGFSNVPGPKNGFRVAGSLTNTVAFVMPVGKTIPGSIGILSNLNNVKVIITTDRACADPKVLANYFEENLDEILGSTEWRKWNSRMDAVKK